MQPISSANANDSASSSDELRDATAGLTRRFVEHLRNVEHPAPLQRPLQVWAEAEGGPSIIEGFMPRRTFVLRDRPLPDMEHIAARDRQTIEAWREYERVAALLKRDQFSRWLSQPGQAAPNQTDPYLAATHVPVRYGQARWRQDWDDALFNRLCDALITALSNPKSEIDLICPINGFATEVDLIELSPGVRICRLADDSIVRLLEFGFGEMRSFQAHAPNSALWMWTHGIFITYEAAPNEIGQAMDRAEPWIALAKLRGFKPGRVSIAGGMARWRSPFPASSASGWHNQDHGFPWFETYRLSSPEIPQFLEFSKNLDRHMADDAAPKEEKRRLELCLNRLSWTAERETDSDRLLDCCNVAELLFSYGAGSIAYKVALRVAVAAHSKTWAGAEVFDLVSDAYAFRNKLAHGGGEEPTRELVDKMEAVLRFILSASLQAAHCPIPALRNEVEARTKARLFPEMT